MEGLRFVLIGKAGSGKDTVADYLVENYGFEKLSFAAKLKEIAQEMFPELWRADKRNMLQQLGMKLREIKENVWVDYLMNNLPEGNIVITDCRYPNEYYICKEQGFTTVRIYCDDQIRDDRIYKRDGKRMTPAEMSHVSERLNVPCDYHLDNNFDRETLYGQIDLMIEQEGKNEKYLHSWPV